MLGTEMAGMGCSSLIGMWAILVVSSSEQQFESLTCMCGPSNALCSTVAEHACLPTRLWRQRKPQRRQRQSMLLKLVVRTLFGKLQ